MILQIYKFDRKDGKERYLLSGKFEADHVLSKMVTMQTPQGQARTAGIEVILHDKPVNEGNYIGFNKKVYVVLPIEDPLMGIYKLHAKEVQKL